MPRDRSADNNVLPFPQADTVRIERAIAAFDRGDQSAALLEEFRLLAERGVKEANYFLGCIFEDGSNGAARDLQKAIEHYEESVNGFGYVEGYLAVARLLYHGLGVRQDLSKAFEYYHRVATRHKHPVACFMLGRMYQRGEGTSPDAAVARSWYSKAVASGSIYGMLNLAMLEFQQGNWLKALWLRIRAGVNAFLIARKDRRDIRLRGG